MSGTKRITIDNTLDERLHLLEDRVRALLHRLFRYTPLLISDCLP